MGMCDMTAALELGALVKPIAALAVVPEKQVHVNRHRAGVWSTGVYGVAAKLGSRAWGCTEGPQGQDLKCGPMSYGESLAVVGASRVLHSIDHEDQDGTQHIADTDNPTLSLCFLLPLTSQLCQFLHPHFPWGSTLHFAPLCGWRLLTGLLSLPQTIFAHGYLSNSCFFCAK